MYRAGITKTNGEIDAQNFNTKDEAEFWILEQADKYDIKKAILVNKENIKEREIINF